MSDPSRQAFVARDRDVAVVGMAGRFPGARDLDELWRLLAEGREAVTTLTDADLLAAGVAPDVLARPEYVKAASLLDGVDEFDAPFFGFTAREAALLDPQQRLFLEHAWAALEDAGVAPRGYPGLIGVYAGVAWNTYLLSNLRDHPELFEGAGGFQVFITNDKDFMPTRASYKLDLKGPSMIVQTSCSTSLVAIHLAALSLLNYECDLALAGGVTVRVPQHAGYLHQDGGLASPDGHCRPFDADAAGTIFGSGVGVVALKRLADALADGDAIRAVLRGSAINNDGSLKVSYTAPSVEGQAEVIAAAQAVAEVEPESVGYVECHGTGTSLGDPVEVAALAKAFGPAGDRPGSCALGSIKSNLGHLDAAAGVAGFIKAVLALEHRQVPPSVNFRRPNPAIDFGSSRFRVATELTPWETDGVPRRAGVSSFGVGGTNAHVVLEEAPARPPATPSRPWQLLPVSARSPETVAQSGERLAAALAPVADAGMLADAAWTLQTGRQAFGHRRAVVATDAAEAAAALAGGPGLLAGAWDDDGSARPVVFLLPGQGSQHAGMAAGLYRHEAVFRGEIDRAAEVLAPRLGLDLRRLLLVERGCAEADEVDALLRETRLAQPALFAVEWALARLWESWGVAPRALVGHSLGELVAAALAGVFAFDDALALVAERGRLMQEAPSGAMLAVPLAPDELASLLAPELAIAALNEPGRATVAGPQEAVAALAAELAARGVDARRLHTSHAFHSAAMDEVIEPFAAAVARVPRQAPSLPFVSNVSGTWITPEQAVDPAYWGRQLRATVRFADGLAAALAEPVPALLEVGPGTTLATLARRHPARGGAPVVASLAHPREAMPDLRSLLAALGGLWVAGVAVDWTGFRGEEERRRVPLPTYPFERRRYWIDGVAATSRQTRPALPGKRSDIASWASLPTWEIVPPAPAPAIEAAAAGPWLVVAADGSPGAELADELATAGADVVRVAPALSADDSPAGEAPLAENGVHRVALDDEAAWRALLADLAAAGRRPRSLVWAAAWEHAGAPSAADFAAFTAAQQRGFGGLVALVRALSGDAAEIDLTVLADGLAAVTGAEPLRPEKAPLLGIVRVLPQEAPGLRARAVDPGAARGAEAARRLLVELASGGREEEIAWRGRQRWALRHRPLPLPPAEPLPDGAYLVTGDASGNAAAIARFVARRPGARLALLADAAEPSPAEAAEERQRGERRVAELEAAGAEVLSLTADLADPAAVARAVRTAEERFGPLAGVFHAAATYGERTFRVLEQTGAGEADWHLRPKVGALYALDAALAERPATRRVLVSSLATVVGGFAYGAYVAASLAADALVEELARRGGPAWLAVDLDVWELPGEREQITELSRDLAALAMSEREGEEVLARALASGESGRLLVSTEDLGVRLARRREQTEARLERRSAAPSAHPRPDLSTPFASPESELERRIAGAWQALLGFERVGLDDNFFELGGDSFVAVQAAARLQEELGVELPVARLYEGLTVRSLAALLATAEEGERARVEHLEERRRSMDRRKRFQQQRRERAAGEPAHEKDESDESARRTSEGSV